MESTVIQRIKTIINKYGLNPNSFSKRINATSSTINSMLEKETNPSFETITKIINAFPLISIEWLIVGKGEIELLDYDKEDVLNKIEEPEEKYIHARPEIYLLEKELQFKDEQIEFYKNKIEFLENKIYDFKSGQKKQNGTDLT
jgi:transcriptional regulator with XRE-family HTH domain